MFQFLLSGLRAGLRARTIQSILVFGGLLMGVAYLSASFSPRQPSTVALDVGFSGLRICLILFVISLVQELVGKEIDRRTVMLSFAYPVSRAAYALGRYLGIISLAALSAIMLSLLLLVVVMVVGGDYPSDFGMLLGLPFWAAVFGLWLDACVVAAFALCIASLSTVSVLPLVLGLVFAVAGKSLGAVADYLGRGADGDEALVQNFSGIVEMIFWVLPDLSRLDWRTWPMYGVAPESTTLVLSLAMALAYVSTMLSLAVYVLKRRELT